MTGDSYAAEQGWSKQCEHCHLQVNLRDAGDTQANMKIGNVTFRIKNPASRPMVIKLGEAGREVRKGHKSVTSEDCPTILKGDNCQSLLLAK